MVDEDRFESVAVRLSETMEALASVETDVSKLTTLASKLHKRLELNERRLAVLEKAPNQRIRRH